MNQILYAGKQRVKEWVIITFVALLWIFSISLTFNGVYSAINESKPIFKKPQNIIIKVENKTNGNENNQETPINNTVPPTNNEVTPPTNTETPPTNTEVPGYTIEGPGGSDVPPTQSGGIVINDMTKPTITVTKPQANKLRVISRDNNGLQYITYKWNDQSETKIEISSGRAVLISIPTGKNVITIKACDLSGNIETYTGTYSADMQVSGYVEGQNPSTSTDTSKPRIYFGRGNPISITIIDDLQLSSVTYSLNGNVQNVQMSNTTKSISFKLSLPTGTNQLTITAIDKSGNKEEISRTIET